MRSTDQEVARPVFRHRRLVLLLGATLALSTACTTATKQTTAQAPSAAPTSTVTVTAGPSGTSASSVAGSVRPSATPSSVLPVPSTPATSAPASSAPAPSGSAGCATAALSVVALRGSGAAGHQYAFLQFTNKSSKACSLTGFPGVQLLRAGAVLGKPATRAAKATARIQLAPGHSATARLVDASTCNAEKSDAVQIYPPNRTERVVVPLSVRGCALTIDPVVAG